MNIFYCCKNYAEQFKEAQMIIDQKVARLSLHTKQKNDYNRPHKRNSAIKLSRLANNTVRKQRNILEKFQLSTQVSKIEDRNSKKYQFIPQKKLDIQLQPFFQPILSEHKNTSIQEPISTILNIKTQFEQTNILRHLSQHTLKRNVDSSMQFQPTTFHCPIYSQRNKITDPKVSSFTTPLHYPTIISVQDQGQQKRPHRSLQTSFRKIDEIDYIQTKSICDQSENTDEISIVDQREYNNVELGLFELGHTVIVRDRQRAGRLIKLVQ